MNIAMFTNNYKPFVGGVPISIERLAESLRDKGHNVYVFAPSYEQEIKDDEFTIRCKSINGPWNEIGASLPDITDPMIENKFKTLNIDIIHVHHPFLMGSLGNKFGKKYKIPVIQTYHTKYEQYAHNVPVYKELYKNEDNSINQSIIRFTEDKMIPSYMSKFSNKCDSIIAPTDSISDYLKSINVSTNIDVIPTGLSNESFMPNEDKVKDIKEKYKGNKKFLFCTVSRLSREKNIGFIIDGMKLFKERAGDNFKLIIIGDGPMRDELQTKVNKLGLENNIELVGSIDNKEIKNYYKASDIFVFASKSETQGIVLLEAMAGKTPVVAISASGVNDILENNINGLITKDDLYDWVNKLYSITDNYNLYRQCKIGAFETANEYSQDKIANMMLKSYKKCAISYNKENKYEKIYRKFAYNMDI